ncbi:hypothetical protein ACH4UM_38995 [Streptomyces sp. NPDC020801]|uniref:hypothetical protein n=1 Tax=unclassified Streptomyces TaxID=2593676 RepID=UPI0037973506
MEQLLEGYRSEAEQHGVKVLHIRDTVYGNTETPAGPAEQGGMPMPMGSEPCPVRDPLCLPRGAGG